MEGKGVQVVSCLERPTNQVAVTMQVDRELLVLETEAYGTHILRVQAGCLVAAERGTIRSVQEADI